MSIDPKDIKAASRVAKFLMELCEKYPDRWRKAEDEEHGPPFGDLAYGAALARWYSDGRRKNAWFSWEENQHPCPYIMEFRKELTEEFGLRILTAEESKEEDKKNTNVIVRKVTDWGPN